MEWLVESFPFVKPRDEDEHGEYRTKRVILEIYDAMAESIRTGTPYQTRLDPPPGPRTDPDGTFAPLPEWLPDQPKPGNWPPHIHPPRHTGQHNSSPPGGTQAKNGGHG